MTTVIEKNRLFAVITALMTALAAALSLMTGCSQSAVDTPFRFPEGVSNVLVVDFRDMTKKQPDKGTIRCPLSGQMFEAGEVSPGAEAFLSQELKRLIGNQKNFKHITAQKMWKIQSRMLHGGQSVSELQLLQATGRKLGAEAVMTGYIYRFRERIGKKYSAETPASVAFDMHLVRVADGRVLWSKDYDETQKPLTEDLFQLPRFLKRDGQWVTARQMASAGMERMFNGIAPKGKNEQ